MTDGQNYLDEMARTALRSQTRALLRDDRADVVRENINAARARGDTLAVEVIEEVVEERRAMTDLKRARAKEQRAELKAWNSRNAKFATICVLLGMAVGLLHLFGVFKVAGPWPMLGATLLAYAGLAAVTRPVPRRFR